MLVIFSTACWHKTAVASDIIWVEGYEQLIKTHCGIATLSPATNNNDYSFGLILFYSSFKHRLHSERIWAKRPCSNYRSCISLVQSSGLQPFAYLNHLKWLLCLGENSLVMVTLSLFQWADSLPLACLVNSESFFWFGLSKPHRTSISCWFKCFSYDGTKEYRLGLNWAVETKYHHERKKKSLKAWFGPSGPWCEGYIKGPSTLLATIKQATRKLCNVALYLKNESISETAVALI